MAELKKPFSLVLSYTYGTAQEQEIACHGSSLAEVQLAYSKHVEELRASRVFRWKSAMLYCPSGSYKLAHPDNVAQTKRQERLPKNAQIIKLEIGQAMPETLHTLTQGTLALSPAGYPLANGERIFMRTDKVGKIRLVWQGIACKVFAVKTGKKTYELHIKRPAEKVPACNKAGWKAQVGAEIIKTKRQKADREKRLACLEIAG